MRSIWIGVALMLTGGTSLAQGKPDTAGPLAFASPISNYSVTRVLHLDDLYAGPPTPPGILTRRFGRLLTAGGAISLTAGIIVLKTNRSTTIYENEIDWRYIGVGFLGLAAVANGVGMMTPGLILWRKGQRRYAAFRFQQNLSVRTNGAGLALRLRL